MRRYLVDANILINFSIFAPIKYHQNFWRELAKQINHGNLVLLDAIAHECKNEELKVWLEQVKNSIIKVDDDIKQRATAINREHNIITTSPTGQVKSAADTHLIAYAQKRGLAIFTYEGRRRSERDPKKIPDVCRDVGVHYQRFSVRVMDELAFAECSR